MLMKWTGQQISTNAYQVLAGYYDQLMDEVDYDAWCDYVLSQLILGYSRSIGPRCRIKYWIWLVAQVSSPTASASGVLR